MNNAKKVLISRFNLVANLYAKLLLSFSVDALFKKGSKINQEHKSKYIYLLAYASSVCDNWNFKRGTRKSLNKDELKGT